MLKKILAKIQKLELQKQNKIASLTKIQTEKQAEIDDIDIKLKKLNSFKKDYEKYYELDVFRHPYLRHKCIYVVFERQRRYTRYSRWARDQRSREHYRQVDVG